MLNNVRFWAKVHLLIFCISNSIFAEGFIAGTLIKIKDGYVKVEDIKKDDIIATYNFQNKTLAGGRVLKLNKKKYNCCYQIGINGTSIFASPDTKFYCPMRKGNWILAKDLQEKDVVICGIKELVHVTYIRKLDIETEFYCPTVEKHHSFFVSKKDIFVHNFEPFTITLGSIWGFVVALDISIPLIGGGVLIAKHLAEDRNKFPSDKNLAYTTAAATGANIFYKKMTNKEAREEAKKLKDRGLGDWDPDPSVKNDKDPYLPVFKNKKRNMWISPDVDQHKGSVWKRLNRNGERTQSLDQNLNPVGD